LWSPNGPDKSGTPTAQLQLGYLWRRAGRGFLFGIFGGLLSQVASAEEAKERRSWCEILQDDPGRIYESDENPFLQEIDIGGRFHYQAAYVEGEDAQGKSFSDSYDEYRRLRLETQIEFLKYFKAEVNSNLVDDRRFEDEPPQELEWGHQDWDTLTLEIDFDSAFDLEVVDKLEFVYGRMKLKVGEEAHQSSKEIWTIERSSLSEKIGPDEGRPTGGILHVGKNDWEVSAGVFSGAGGDPTWASWEYGRFYYASLAWEPGDFRFVYDHVVNDGSGPLERDMALEYGWVGSFSAVYERDDWGLMVNLAQGDNGGTDEGNVRERRQGDFWGVVVMPWYWLVEDRLQIVFSYEHMDGEGKEGIRLDDRYVAARHDRGIDVERGRGEQSDVFYGGLNFYLCDHNAKFMAGISQAELDSRTGPVSATSYMIAFRTYF
jgi:hypothetical protein